MDKTAFIPKKPTSRPFYKTKGPGIFFVASLLALVFSGMFAGGVYVYEKMLEKRVNLLSQSLERANAAFEPALITELNRVSEKIESSKILLENHRMLTPIFDFLRKFTLKSVRFSKFSVEFGKEGEALVSMNGTAKSYSSLALQMEEFQKDKSVEKLSVSGLSPSKDGFVKFNIEMAFNKNFIKYRER